MLKIKLEDVISESIRKNGSYDFIFDFVSPKKRMNFQLNKKHNLVYGLNGTGKTVLSRDLMSIINNCKSYNFFKVPMQMNSDLNIEQLIEEKKKLKFIESEVIWKLKIGETRIVCSKWINNRNILLKEAVIISLDDKAKTLIQEIDFGGVYVSTNSSHYGRGVTTEHIDIFIKKTKYMVNNYCNMTFLRKLIATENPASFARTEVKSLEKIFGDNNIEDKFVYSRLVESKNTEINYREVVTESNWKEKIGYYPFLSNILKKHVLIFYKKENIDLALSGLSKDKYLDIYYAYEHIFQYLSSVFEKGVQIIGEKFNNAIGWTLSSHRNKLFPLAAHEWLLKFNDELRENFKENKELIKSVDNNFSENLDKIKREIDLGLVEKTTKLKEKLIKWLGFEDKIKFEEGTFKYLSGTKTMSTGWGNMVNKIINPLSNIDLWEAKHAIICIDDPTDALDEMNIFSVATTIKNLDKIIGTDISLKNIIFSHNSIFTKRFSQIAGGNITELTRNFRNDNFSDKKTKADFNDYATMAFENIKQHIDVISPFLLFNQARIIMDWVNTIKNEDQIKEILGDSYIFVTTHLNPWSHYNQAKDIGDEQKIRDGIKAILNILSNEFPIKFKPSQ